MYTGDIVNQVRQLHVVARCASWGVRFTDIEKLPWNYWRFSDVPSQNHSYYQVVTLITTHILVTLCYLLLQISHVAWSVCLCVCVMYTGKLYKNGRTDRDAVWGLTGAGPKNHCIRCGQNRTNSFAAARGYKSTMRPFAELLSTFVCLIVLPLWDKWKCSIRNKKNKTPN